MILFVFQELCYKIFTLEGELENRPSSFECDGECEAGKKKKSEDTGDLEHRLKTLRFELERMRTSEQQMKNSLAEKDGYLEKASEQHNAMTNTIKKLRSEISQMNMIIERLGKSNDTMTVQTTERVEKAEKDKAALESCFLQIRKVYIENMSANVGMSEEELKSLSTGGFSNLLCDSMVTSEKKRIELESSVEKLTEEKNLLLENLKEAQNKFKLQIKTQASKLDKERSVITEQYQELKDKYTDVLSQGNTYEGKLADLKKDNASLQATCKHRLAQVNKLLEENRDLSDKMKTADKEIKTLKTTRQKQTIVIDKTEVNNWKAKCSEIEEVSRVQDSTIKKLNATNVSLKQRLKETNDALVAKLNAPVPTSPKPKTIPLGVVGNQSNFDKLKADLAEANKTIQKLKEATPPKEGSLNNKLLLETKAQVAHKDKCIKKLLEENANAQQKAKELEGFKTQTAKLKNVINGLMHETKSLQVKLANAGDNQKASECAAESQKRVSELKATVDLLTVKEEPVDN